jgi:hypothetical protein
VFDEEIAELRADRWAADVRVAYLEHKNRVLRQSQNDLLNDLSCKLVSRGASLVSSMSWD